MLLERVVFLFFFFQAEDGIRDLVRSRGLGDVYKRQGMAFIALTTLALDGSNLYAQRRRMQTAADAAALALSLIHI